MKSFLMMVFIVTVACAAVDAQSIPTKACPPGEHSVLYCPQMAEPSCDNPTVHKLKYPGPCDIPQCFCDVPQVRSRAGRCVPLSDC